MQTDDTVMNTRTFGFLITEVDRLYRRRFRTHASDLTLLECKVLWLLARNQGLSQARLATLADADRMALTRALDRLQHFQWIERRPDPCDRRVNRLYLCAAAEPTLARIAQASDKANQEALAGIGEAERERLLELLERLCASLALLETDSA
jgi:MarR family transcriptional regulator, transcriptional regulator for hemolysin